MKLGTYTAGDVDNDFCSFEDLRHIHRVFQKLSTMRKLKT